MMPRAYFAVMLAAAALAGFLGGLLAVLWFPDPSAFAQQRFKAVNSEEFLLVDAFGKTRAGLGLDQKGELGFVLVSKDGAKTLYLSPDDTPAIRLKDKTGRVLWAAP